MFKFTGVPGVTPSKGALNRLMDKLLKVYQKSGGNKFGVDEDETEGLSTFDALKILISKKITVARKTIKEVEEARTLHSKTQKKQDVRKMIQFIEQDLEKLRLYHEKFKTPKFLKKKPDEKLIKNQEEDIDLIAQHVKEVIACSQKKYQRKVSKKTKKKMSELVSSGSDDSDNEDEDDEKGDLSGIEVELPDDPTQSNLPEIDISQSMMQVKKNKQELQKGLQVFQQRLADVKQQALDIGDQLDEGKQILEDIEQKAEDRSNELSKVNKSAEKARNQVNQGTKITIIVILIVAAIICVIVVYFILVQTGVLSW